MTDIKLAVGIERHDSNNSSHNSYCMYWMFIRSKISVLSPFQPIFSKAYNAITLILAYIIQMNKLSLKAVQLSRVLSGRERAHDTFLWNQTPNPQTVLLPTVSHVFPALDWDDGQMHGWIKSFVLSPNKITISKKHQCSKKAREGAISSEGGDVKSQHQS